MEDREGDAGFVKETIKFGEVAQAPPLINAAPRRAPVKSKSEQLSVRR